MAKDGRNLDDLVHGYHSKGEAAIAQTLAGNERPFVYQPSLDLRLQKYTGKGKIPRNPNFRVGDVVIEYIGKPDDKDYMKTIVYKKQMYEKEGLRVVYISRDDIFDKDKG